jgi:hypothetical protein
MLVMVFTFLWYQEFNQMVNYSNNDLSQTESFADLDTLGEKSIKEIGIMPFYSVYYKGSQILKEDKLLCGEFQGDCYQFVTKYLKLIWLDKKIKELKDWNLLEYEKK